MRSAPVSRLGRCAAWLFAAAVLFAHTAAQACPGCKQATEGRGGISLNGASIGFSLSIFFMIFMIVSILGGLGFMMYRSCRALAARDAQGALPAEAEAEAVTPIHVGTLQPRPA